MSTTLLRRCQLDACQGRYRQKATSTLSGLSFKVQTSYIPKNLVAFTLKAKKSLLQLKQRLKTNFLCNHFLKLFKFVVVVVVNVIAVILAVVVVGAVVCFVRYVSLANAHYRIR